MSSFKKCLEKEIRDYEQSATEYESEIARMEKNINKFIESLKGCNEMLNMLRTKIGELKEMNEK